ncbi:MAG: hypothetical protein JXB08_00340 [Bacilli bacterium]|nr:hypothetical protein [Bacilli bacterium]MBN2876824.1 hypothetical protein [Bacilli bacterium]
MERSKIIAYAFITITTILCVIGIFILPDPLVIQMTLDGSPGTTVAKWLGLVILFLFGVFGGYVALANNDDPKPWKSYLVMGVFLVVEILIFIFNL